MNINFTLACSDFKTIKEIQGFWTPQKYVELLEVLDYPDVASIAVNELKEMPHGTYRQRT